MRSMRPVQNSIIKIIGNAMIKRELLKRALIAIDRLVEQGIEDFIPLYHEIEKELAKPEIEPVGVIIESGGTLHCFSTSSFGMKNFAVDTKVYTEPPKREPLSDEEIGKMIDMLPDNIEFVAPYFEFARAIECAHNIGVEHE